MKRTMWSCVVVCAVALTCGGVASANSIYLYVDAAPNRVDGPGLTPAERAKIEAKQDALSGKIAKEKHDAQTQKKQ